MLTYWIKFLPYLKSRLKLSGVHEEKIALYERMLKEKDEMMGRLERLIGGG